VSRCVDLLHVNDYFQAVKKLQEIVMNPLQNNPFLSRPTGGSRRHDRDRNERNVARRLEQALEVVC
jgi:hypothetical protein